MGAGQTVWLDHLDRDHDNLHAAVRWAIEHQDGELGLRLAASLSYFWYFRGHHTEGRALARGRPGASDRPELATLRVAAIQGEGLLALVQGDYPAARAIVEEGVAIGRSGERALLPPMLATLGFVARVQEDYEVGRAALEEAIEVAREVGDTFYTGMALHHFGLLMLEADRDLGARLGAERGGSGDHAAVGNRRMVGVVALAMGRVAQARGDLVKGRSLVHASGGGVLRAWRPGQRAADGLRHGGHRRRRGEIERAIRLAAAAAAANEAMGTRTWPVILASATPGWRVPESRSARSGSPGSGRRGRR